MSRNLGVGIIGASAERGWAKDSHVPAVHGLDGLKLVAVAAGDEAKAQFRTLRSISLRSPSKFRTTESWCSLP